MTIRSPSTETIRFITKILSVRTTSISELPGLITSIDSTIQALVSPPPVAEVLQMPEKRPTLKLPVIKPKKPIIVPVEASSAPKRGRGRPRRVIELAVPAVEKEQEAPPPVALPEIVPQSRLLRRSDSRPQEHDHSNISEEGAAVRLPQGMVRGVVKWFDGRTGKGVLRLTGVSGDVTLDAVALAKSGIKRLYKDQEIEASVEENRGRIRLVSMALPGRSGSTIGTSDGDNAPVKRARSVMIEIKRDGNRQTAARAEAEQLFARPGKPKPPRRQTP